MIFIYSILGVLFCIALYDVMQKKHTVWRKYPIIGRLRWVMEDLRPKIQQYFVENNTNGTPIPKYQRDIIYQRAKGENDKVPFGTELDLYKNGRSWLNHSNHPLDKKDFNQKSLKVLIGQNTCNNPYNSSIINISAMSYGALNKNAISALALGSKEGKFYLNTGEGGISKYHLNANDIVWQIGTGYFGCRDDKGNFDLNQFILNASRKQVKMIEIKISQGAKPGHGGILPAEKNTQEIADIRGVEPNKTIYSPPYHSEFKNDAQLLSFIEKLRLSCDKPIGIKLCIGNKQEFQHLIKSMLNANIFPDFITIDGAEGGTGAAPLEFTNAVGMPLLDALSFAHNLLTDLKIRDKLKIIASGKIINSFDCIKVLALGADLINMARPFMISMGCIQARQCHSGKCPSVIATPKRAYLLNVNDKKKRVFNFYKATLDGIIDLSCAAGLKDLNKINGTYISIRKNDKVINLKEYYV